MSMDLMTANIEQAQDDEKEPGVRRTEGDEMVVTLPRIDGERLARIMVDLQHLLISEQQQVGRMMVAAGLDGAELHRGIRETVGQPKMLARIAEYKFALVLSHVCRNVNHVSVRVEFSDELAEGNAEVTPAAHPRAAMIERQALELLTLWQADIQSYVFILKTLSEWQQPGREAWVVRHTTVFDDEIDEARSFELGDIEPLTHEHGDYVGFVCPLCERRVLFADAVELDDGYKACPRCTGPMAIVNCGLSD